MGFLSGLFGGSEPARTVTQTTDTAPWDAQQTYLKDIFKEAQNLYKQEGTPSYYPESTVVGFSPETQQALTMTQERALSGSPLQEAAGQQMMGTVQGDYLGGSPYLQQAVSSAIQPVVDQFSQVAAPGIDSQFERAGRMGSGAYAGARNRAEDTLARNLTNMAGSMAYQNYGDERGRQMSATQQAPAFAQTDYQDAQRLAGVGASREAQEQAVLQDQINRFNYQQNLPSQKLAQYSGLVSGGFGSSQQQSTPVYTNPAAGFLSGALGGAALGAKTGLGAGWGGVLGGLAGGFGG